MLGEYARVASKAFVMYILWWWSTRRAEAYNFSSNYEAKVIKDDDNGMEISYVVDGEPKQSLILRLTDERV